MQTIELIAPAQRGYSVTYAVGEKNRCPSCSGTQWNVGRFSAECATCGTALPFASASPAANHLHMAA